MISTPQIRLTVNKAHIATVIAARRALCVGESFRIISPLLMERGH